MGELTSVKKMGHKILNIIAVVICILLIPIIVANVTIIANSFISPNELPGFLGYKPFIVLSDSMLPSIQSGDLVLVKEAETETLKEGDVIAFREGNSVITHRIVKITEENGQRRFTTKGDNNNAEDPLAVRGDFVEGAYIFGIPSIGNAALFIQTPVGMLVVIALPLTLIFIYYILSRRRLDREKHERTRELEQELEKMRRHLSAPGPDSKDRPL